MLPHHAAERFTPFAGCCRGAGLCRERYRLLDCYVERDTDYWTDGDIFSACFHLKREFSQRVSLYLLQCQLAWLSIHQSDTTHIIIYCWHQSFNTINNDKNNEKANHSVIHPLSLQDQCFLKLLTEAKLLPHAHTNVDIQPQNTGTWTKF